MKSYLQLFRLPNVFTAMADILAGYLFTHTISTPTLRLPAEFWLLLTGSALLYTAGMVLNDVYDFEVDVRERPFRPLPSGRISRRLAHWLGYELLLVGAGLGCLAGALAGQLRPCVVAGVLALAVVLYDRILKRTPIAPVIMGSCRFLNVLLGMSVAPFAWHTVHWLVAGGVGVYIVGVTWFARTEARESNRWQLALGAGTMMAGLGMLAAFPTFVDRDLAKASLPEYSLADSTRWYLVWGVMAVIIGRRCLSAILEPVPARVQIAVKNCIFSLIVIDAILCFSARGVGWAIVILLLLVPTMFLGRWVYST